MVMLFRCANVVLLWQYCCVFFVVYISKDLLLYLTPRYFLQQPVDCISDDNSFSVDSLFCIFQLFCGIMSQHPFQKAYLTINVKKHQF